MSHVGYSVRLLGRAWRVPVEHGRLITQLVRREVTGRYRGSVLGMLWALLTPLLMLAIYTFVFGFVIKARWQGSMAADSTAGFAIVLFSGLIVFQLFAEVVTRAPTLVLSNPSYVKKVVFPLSVLVPVAVGTAVFHGTVNFVVLFVFMLVDRAAIPLTALWLPVVLAPYGLMIMGLGWLLASLGVFFRDLSQILASIVTGLMFLSPIFFPLSALPEWVQPWVRLNPIAFPVEEVRAVLLAGEHPRWPGFCLYSLLSIAIALLGYLWFQRTRKGFADVM